MSTPSDGGSVRSLASASINALIREGDKMEAELGRWLAETSARMSARMRGKRAVDGKRPLHSSFFWRGLILLWASSPDARAKFSSESRGGLTMAVTSMDDRSLLCLVEGFLDEAQRQSLDPAA